MDKDFFFSAGFTAPTIPWHQHLLSSSGDLNCPSEQSTECYFNSPPNLQIPILNPNLEIIGITSHVMNTNLPFLPTTTDLAKFSCYGSRSFNGRTTNNVEPSYKSGSMIMKAMLSRVSSSPLFKVAESPVELRSTDSSDTKLDESSVSDSRKRKFASKGKVVAGEPNAKRISKLGEEEESKGIGNNSFKMEKDAGEKKMNQKADPTESEKDYIHVRARRGQATDSHSLAERVRREKISERMKLLQDLVPGCNKVTGKALMLDEIISYVQQLQHNVEFLSMKLSSVNPTRLDITKEPNYPLNSSTALFGHQTQHANIPSGCWAVTQSSVDATLCQNNSTQSSVLDAFGHGHLPKVPSFCENDLHNLVMSFGTRQTEQNIRRI